MHKVQKAVATLVAASAFMWACGATFPVPAQPLADAQSAERSAIELGAHSEPQAQLSLKLAQEQIAEAQKAIAAGENERAASLLVRAKADAEVSIALCREKNAKVEYQKAVEGSTAQKATNVGQGAVK